MNCPNCGKELKDEQKFCKNCGCKLVSSNVFLTRLFSTTNFIIISVLSLLVVLIISVFALINNHLIAYGRFSFFINIFAIISLLILIKNYKTRNLNILNSNVFISCVLTVWLYLFYIINIVNTVLYGTIASWLGTESIIILLMLLFGIYCTYLCLSDKNRKTRKMEWGIIKRALITCLFCCCLYILCAILYISQYVYTIKSMFRFNFWIIFDILSLALLMLFVFIYQKKLNNK